jgi:carbon storage regulator CsrA
MLVLSRKPGERIYVGSGITITVVRVQGNRVGLGIDAPADVRLLRAELDGLPGRSAAESSLPRPPPAGQADPG